MDYSIMYDFNRYKKNAFSQKLNHKMIFISTITNFFSTPYIVKHFVKGIYFGRMLDIYSNKNQTVLGEIY